MVQQSFSTPDTNLPFIVHVALLRTGSPVRKSVLFALASFCLDGDWCYPSTTKIAFRAECCERQARRELSDLERQGLIERRSAPGRSSRYRVPTPDCQSDPPRTVSPPKGTGKRTAIRYDSDLERLHARARAYARMEARRRS